MKQHNSIKKYRITEHAKIQMVRRKIGPDVVKNILSNPEQIVELRPGRAAFQAVIEKKNGQEYMIRIFVDTHVNPPEVVTCYRTSKIEKYRR